MSAPILFSKALLIEDDKSHALLVKRALAGFVGNISECHTLKDAFNALGEHQFEIIITDLHLPDGQVITELGKMVSLASATPILVLTSSTDLRDAIEAMKQGASDFIVKNFDSNFPEVLRIALSRIYTQMQLRAERAKAQREIEVLKVAIDNSNDAMAVVAMNGEIVYSNRSFSSFAKLCAGEFKDLFSIISERVNRREDLLRSLRKNFTDLPYGGVWNSEVTLCDNKDVAFGISLSVIPTKNTTNGGNDKQYVFWVKDISEQKRREKFQREILSTTTHDLKGPLGAIQLSCELLTDGPKDQQRVQDIIVRIESSARNALNLIDEFLSARRIQEGTFILRPTPSDIVTVTKEAIEDFRAIAESRKIALKFTSSQPKIDAKVDKLGYSRVIGNLVSNALKFTPKNGEVNVHCELMGDEVHVSVQDTGSGMEPADVQKLFERFSRLEKHQDIEGSGLGLFVVKSIVSAHGGKVEVSSSVGHGTRFEVTFPVQPTMNERGELISLSFT